MLRRIACIAILLAAATAWAQPQATIEIAGQNLTQIPWQGGNFGVMAVVTNPTAENVHYEIVMMAMELPFGQEPLCSDHLTFYLHPGQVCHPVMSISFEENLAPVSKQYLVYAQVVNDGGQTVALDVTRVFQAAHPGVDDQGSLNRVSPSAFPGEPTLTLNPNPFNPQTVARYEIRDARHVSLRVYDTAGREVATLVDGWREAGAHEVTFDGSALPSGIYLAKLEAGGVIQTQKLVLVK